MDKRFSVKERPNKIVNRLGYWTSRRHEDYQAKDGLSRHCDWSRKLKRPRLSMVADLEEEKIGKKRRIATEEVEEEEEDFNMNFVIKQDVPSEVSYPLDDELVFRVENENFVKIPEWDTYSTDSEDLLAAGIKMTKYLSDSYNSYQFQQENRKFHFTHLRDQTPASITEESVDNVDMDSDLMDEDDRGVGESLAMAKQPEELSNSKVKEEEHNSFSESVLEKIAALKRIDEKLLDIEKEKGKRLKTALSSSSRSKNHGMYQNPKKRLHHRPSSPLQGNRSRRKGKSRSRDVSSSSSISSSDSSSSSNDESTSENEEVIKKNASGQEADDLRNKLKLYLTKLKRKGAKKT